MNYIKLTFTNVGLNLDLIIQFQELRKDKH